MIISKSLEINERKKMQSQKHHHAQDHELVKFYFRFLNKYCYHFISMAVKKRANSSCSTQIYLFPVIEKNTLVGITLF